VEGLRQCSDNFKLGFVEDRVSMFCVGE
jgi:hypothetical protein